MDLTHIKARLEAATPGPWCCQRPTDLNGRRAYEVGPLGAAPVAVALYDSETRDVALIANAPQDIADLLAEVKRLRQIEAAAKGARAGLHVALDGEVHRRSVEEALRMLDCYLSDDQAS